MMRVLLQPYILLGSVALLLLLCSFFLAAKTIDIHLHDTYYILSTAHLFRFFSTFLFVFAVVYRIADGRLFSKRLTWIHIIATLVAPILLFYFIFCSQVEMRYLDVSLCDRFNTLNHFFYWAICGFLIAQALFILNIIGGMFKPRVR